MPPSSQKSQKSGASTSSNDDQQQQQQQENSQQQQQPVVNVVDTRNPTAEIQQELIEITDSYSAVGIQQRIRKKKRKANRHTNFLLDTYFNHNPSPGGTPPPSTNMALNNNNSQQQAGQLTIDQLAGLEEMANQLFVDENSSSTPNNNNNGNNNEMMLLSVGESGDRELGAAILDGLFQTSYWHLDKAHGGAADVEESMLPAEEALVYHESTKLVQVSTCKVLDALPYEAGGEEVHTSVAAVAAAGSPPPPPPPPRQLPTMIGNGPSVVDPPLLYEEINWIMNQLLSIREKREEEQKEEEVHLLLPPQQGRSK